MRHTDKGVFFRYILVGLAQTLKRSNAKSLVYVTLQLHQACFFLVCFVFQLP